MTSRRRRTNSASSVRPDAASHSRIYAHVSNDETDKPPAPAPEPSAATIYQYIVAGTALAVSVGLIIFGYTLSPVAPIWGMQFAAVSVIVLMFIRHADRTTGVAYRWYWLLLLAAAVYAGTEVLAFVPKTFAQYATNRY